VKKGGVPESNIILMMQDDIASDPENVFPGKMFNKPTAKGVPGVDVCVIVCSCSCSCCCSGIIPILFVRRSALTVMVTVQCGNGLCGSSHPGQ
jgi:hypothetical protein